MESHGSRHHRLERYHTSSSEWARDATMRMYTPMLAADAASLYTLAQYVEQLGPKVPLEFARKAARNTPFFFGSHPIRYIQLAGYVVAAVSRPTFPQCTFEIQDGFSELRCGCVYTEQIELQEGQFVCVLGEVSFFHEPQVRVHQIQWHSPSLGRAFMFKQEALDVRRFVLEQPVDSVKQYEALWNRLQGRPVLTEFMQSLPDLPPPFSRIRRSLQTKAAVWGFKSMRGHAAAPLRTTRGRLPGAGAGAT